MHLSVSKNAFCVLALLALTGICSGRRFLHLLQAP